MIVVVFVFTVLFLTLITRFVAGRNIGTNQSYKRAVSLNVWYSFAVLMAQGDYLFSLINQIEILSVQSNPYSKRRILPVKSLVSSFRGRFLVSHRRRPRLRLQRNAHLSRFVANAPTDRQLLRGSGS